MLPVAKQAQPDLLGLQDRLAQLVLLARLVQLDLSEQLARLAQQVLQEQLGQQVQQATPVRLV